MQHENGRHHGDPTNRRAGAQTAALAAIVEHLGFAAAFEVFAAVTALAALHFVRAMPETKTAGERATAVPATLLGETPVQSSEATS